MALINLDEMNRILKFIYRIALYCVALVGLGFIGVYLAMRLHWTDVPGDTDLRSDQFALVAQTAGEDAKADLQPTLEMAETATTLSIAELDQKIADAIAYQSQLETVKQAKQVILCKIEVLAKYDGYDAPGVWSVYQTTQSEVVLQKMQFALEPYLSVEYFTELAACATQPNAELTEESVSNFVLQSTMGHSLFTWRTAEEWPSLAEAVRKDADVINRVATETGVPARLIAASLLVEQLRLYHTQREYYEQYFAPLKILASATKFAWGVMSIKEQTARQIEDHLNDANSPYYLGSDDAHRLDFTTSDTTTERYQRLTNEDDHYYSYLYGALYFKQLMTQWQSAGFDISDRPEILLTLFNIGFEHSEPKVDPAVGGSTLEINGRTYTFGGLGYEIYYSSEFLENFPLLP